jgi:hypothetical protein
MAHQKVLSTLAVAKENQECVGIIDVKKYKEPHIRVNLCWQIGDDKKCVTLPKEHAYETRDWVESQNGCVFWFQALPD